MPGETLTFDIFANDRASETFRRLGLAADSASGDVRQLGERLDKLGARVTTARVGLDGNKEANVELDKLDLKLIRLGKKVANPSIDVEGKVKALADIAAVDLAMDRLNKKFASPSLGSRLGKGLVSAKGFGSLLSSLFGGGGAASAAGAPAAASAGAGLADFLGSPAGIGTIAAGAPFAAALIDALAGFGVGAAGAGAGGLLVQKFQPGVLAPGLTNIQKTLSTVAQSIGPSLGLMMVQFGKFVQGLAPTLAKLFASTLPFMKSFLSFAEQAAKTALPALTQVMQQMVSSGALKAMTQGFVILVQGLAGFIKELGPGFKAGALIFRALAIGIRTLLYGLGAALGWLGKVTGDWLTQTHKDWDSFRHDTAAVFDYVKGSIAAAWDQIWNNTIARMARGVRDIQAEWAEWRHNTAVIFDAVRRDIEDAWNTIWNWTGGRVRTGIGDVVNFFRGMPSRVIGALFGLGHQLYAFARAALGEFWSGLKSIGGSIVSWLGGLWNNIVGAAKKILGVFSPSKVFYDIGKNLMVGLFHGIRDHASRAVSAASGAVGAVSGSAASAQAYARRLAAAYGWAGQWADINAVAMRESGWSLTARNPSSGAYGIAQFINGPSEYFQYGGNPSTIAGQVTAFFNYIKQRYGDPAAAWGHELSYGWYDRGGWLKPGLTLAYNATGRPEMVVPGSSGGGYGGRTVIVNVQVGHGTHPVAAAREIARLLNDGAKSGVKLRTSILGPG